ncbi:MAG: chitobiase/beta-hexosaminidase C-terminal domain-containing protein [bacterium]
MGRHVYSRIVRIVLVAALLTASLVLAGCPLAGAPPDLGETPTEEGDAGEADTGDDAGQDGTDDDGNDDDDSGDPGDTDPGATASPAFDPAPGTYTANLEVTIVHGSADAVIHVTTDGSSATTDAPAYTDPIAVNGDGATVTIRAVAKEPDKNPSREIVGTFDIDYPDAAAPSISPSSGEFLGEAEVTMATSTPGATVYYTVDGTTPTTASSAYAEPLIITETATLRAIAAADGLTPSAETSASITITPALLVRAQGPDDQIPGAPIPDDQPGSLRDVIANAPAGSTIAFATDFYDDDDDDTTSLDAIGILKSDGSGLYVEGILIDKDITIDGAGRTVELDGLGLGRHFTVLDGATLTMANIVLQNGGPAGNGGAIEVQSGGSLALTDVTIRDSTAFESNGPAYAGGAIFAQEAEVEITGGSFSGNMAARGGAIDVGDTTLRIEGVEFSNNNGNLFAGGAVRLVGTQSVGTFQDVHFETNSAAQWGGAIAVVGGAVASIHGSTFLENEVYSISENDDGGGGALYIGGGSDYGTVTVATSQFIRNETQNFGDSLSAAGGAILSDGRLLHVAASEFYGNRSDGNGAAIALDQGGEGEFVVSSSVFAGNSVVSEFPSGLFSGTAAIHSNAEHNEVALSSFAGNTGNETALNLWFENLTASANVVRNSAFDTIGMNLERIGVVSHSIAPEGFDDPEDALNGLLRTDNVTADPGFTTAPSHDGDGFGQDTDDYGDLRLEADSPAVDAGDAAAVPLDLADMDQDGDKTEVEPWDVTGGARVVGNSVDMGAYEH